ncbi:unnamed protein product, partial [Mesorhabditis spiculigera]
MDSCDKLNLVKFWMHVDGFRASIVNISDASRATAEQMCFLDAKHIFGKYLDEESPTSIGLPKKIYARVASVIESGRFDPRCFDEAQSFVKDLFELRYHPEFMNSIYYKKHELDVLTREECPLMHILRVEPLLAGFLERMVEVGEQNLVEMILAVDTWESQWPDTVDSEVLDDAMAIYDRYFSMQAERSRIALSDENRMALEARICTDSGRPQRDAFKAQKYAALLHLEEKYLHPFRQSPVFAEYISDLTNTIANTIELPRIGGKIQRSRDDSLDRSSGRDSLPALLTNHLQNPRTMGAAEDHNSQSSETNPYSCQQNLTPVKKSGGLAEVDSMGRYTPLYDTSFTMERENAQSKLKMKLRRYLDKSSLREEELAEEVARTIIADIQTMVDSAAQ